MRAVPESDASAEREGLRARAMSEPNQIRISELARELEVKAKAILDYLAEIGVTEKKTHSSLIDVSAAEKVRKHFRELAEAEAAAEATAAAEKAAKEAAAKAARMKPRVPPPFPLRPAGAPPGMKPAAGGLPPAKPVAAAPPPPAVPPAGPKSAAGSMAPTKPAVPGAPASAAPVANPPVPAPGKPAAPPLPTPFSQATAEEVVAAVEAVFVNRKPTSVDFVAEFADIPRDRAEAALKLASDLGLLGHNAGRYSPASPLCRLLSTPNLNLRAAVLRVVLESYKPFVFFRERLVATDLAVTAAQQTRAALELDARPDVIRDTLISLGTYSHALETEGGGVYRPAQNPAENVLLLMAQGCRDLAAAEARIRLELGEEAAGIVSREDVLVPLADALLRAGAGDARGAVLHAANAVESYLETLSARLGVNVAGAAGINAKLRRFADARALPSKLIAVGKYLGNIRNAADHGADAEVGAAWQVQRSTGLNFPFVGCSFIAAVTARERNRPPQI